MTHQIAPSEPSESGMGPGVTADAPRRVSVPVFIALVVGYVGIAIGVAALLADGDDAYGAPTTVEYIVRNLVIPVGLAIIFVMIATAVIGGWSSIFTTRNRFRRWMLVIPAILLGAILLITNYPGLANKGLEFTLILLIATLMVGFGEELLFRGIGVHAFRSSGFSEFKVGLWTTLIFAIAHGSNVFTTGSKALIQVVATAATGFVFYLILRPPARWSRRWPPTVCGTSAS